MKKLLSTLFLIATLFQTTKTVDPETLSNGEALYDFAELGIPAFSDNGTTVIVDGDSRLVRKNGQTYQVASNGETLLGYKEQDQQTKTACQIEGTVLTQDSESFVPFVNAIRWDTFLQSYKKTNGGYIVVVGKNFKGQENGKLDSDTSSTYDCDTQLRYTTYGPVKGDPVT